MAGLANSFMQCLAVTPSRNSLHQYVFGSHEREGFSRVTPDYFGVDYQTITDIQQETQDAVARQESLRQDKPPIDAIVQRALQPLSTRRLGGAVGQGDKIASQTTNSLGAHRISLVMHG